MFHEMRKALDLGEFSASYRRSPDLEFGSQVVKEQIWSYAGASYHTGSRQEALFSEGIPTYLRRDRD